MNSHPATVRAPHPGVWRLRLPLMRSSEKMHEAFLVRSAQIRYLICSKCVSAASA